MINNVVLVGRLTKDPVLRNTPSGVAVASFTLAINRSFKNANGDRDADFINVIAFRKTAELCSQYLSKGIQAGAVGRIQTRNYDKDGQRVYVTEVVAESIQFLESNTQQNQQYQRPYNNQQNNYQPNNYQSQQQNNYQHTNQSNNHHQPNPFANANTQVEINNDDLPF
ncbi:single-stranded DNA-binding protein [Staphylococcus epidermidis]|nr:single-stranded DNA-binding protein [Staphylococcus epidermidis]